MAEYETSDIAIDASLAGLIEGKGEHPLSILKQWRAYAASQCVSEPDAIALATSDAGGRSSVRIMHVIEIDKSGILFASHEGSRKGRDIAATRYASGVFYWRETKQQILFSGCASVVSNDISDRFWLSRPLQVNAMSAVAHQSQTLVCAETLRKEAQAVIDRGIQPSRPPGWSGFHVELDRVEFWIARSDRLHTRVEFERYGEGWSQKCLQP